MATQTEGPPRGGGSLDLDDVGSDHYLLEKTKTLICALNLLSRNLPLPDAVLDAVSSICSEAEEGVDDGGGVGGSEASGGERIETVPVRFLVFRVVVDSKFRWRLWL